MLNVVMNAEQLQKDVENGRWSEVIPALSHLRLPLNKLMNLYEQIVLEMLEVREVDVARTMMKETAVMVKMKQSVPERFKQLESLVSQVGGDGVQVKASFTSNEEEMAKLLYAGGGRKESRRKEIAMELMREIPAVEPSRLLALMTKALKYANEHEEIFPSGEKEGGQEVVGEKAKSETQGSSSSLDGAGAQSYASTSTSTSKSNRSTSTSSSLISSHYDIFLGRFPLEESEEEKEVKKMSSQLSFKSAQSAPETVRFSPDGSMLLTGARDGFIEIYNPHTCLLREDLAFQKDENFMALSSAIMAFAFNKNAQYLVAGSQEGSCSIFRLATGECVKEFAKIHSAPISSLHFAKDDATILSSSLDGNIHLLGLKSGKIIKTFSPNSFSSSHASHQHASSNTSAANQYVISAHFNRDNSQVIAAYADGYVRVYANDAARLLLHTFEPGDHPISGLNDDEEANYEENRSGGGQATAKGKTLGFSKSRDIHSLLPLGLPGQHTFIVGTRSNCLFLMNSDGQTIKVYRNENPTATPLSSGPSSSSSSAHPSSSSTSLGKGLISSSTLLSANDGIAQLGPGAFSPFVTACLSPHAHLLYAVTQDSFLVCFDVLSAKRLSISKIHDAEVIGLHHHPFRNLLLSFAVDGSLKTWKP